jgi:hypothetical protein
MKNAKKEKFCTKSLFMAVALISLLLLVLGPAQVGAVTCSSSMPQIGSPDTDFDGFTDYQECLTNGVNTPTDLSSGKNKIYGQLKCPGTGSNPACASGTTCHCLDPNKKDLFAIIVKPASGSLLGSLFPSNTDFLQYVDLATSAGGLGIVVHPIYPTMTPLDRTVMSGSSQKAVMITESLDVTSMDVLGVSNTGNPNGLDKTTIYTARIKAFLQTACGGTGTYPNITGGTYGTANCADSTDLSGAKLLTNYILHTIAHEVGHVLGPLAPVYNANYGGNHYKSGTNVIMDQSIYYTKSGIKVTFYIGTGYTGSDQTSVKLKQY